MVHSLIPMAVKIKITNFEEPARLINCMELTSALGMACRQAGLPMPACSEGTGLKEFRDNVMEDIGENPRVDVKLLTVIRDYIFKAGETIDADALETLKLGYEYEFL